MLLSGLALACAGVFRYSTPAGMIISGLVLALLGKATAMKMPQEKKI